MIDSYIFFGRSLLWRQNLHNDIISFLCFSICHIRNRKVAFPSTHGDEETMHWMNFNKYLWKKFHKHKHKLRGKFLLVWTNKQTNPTKSITNLQLPIFTGATSWELNKLTPWCNIAWRLVAWHFWFLLNWPCPRYLEFNSLSSLLMWHRMNILNIWWPHALCDAGLPSSYVTPAIICSRNHAKSIVMCSMFNMIHLVFKERKIIRETSSCLLDGLKTPYLYWWCKVVWWWTEVKNAEDLI